jgi:rhodanese-related sulfurtransferase
MLKPILLIISICTFCYGYKNLSQDSLAFWLQTAPPFDFILIDARDTNEITTMIGNINCKPYNLPWNSSFKQLSNNLPKEQHIIIYCQSGNRAGKASSYLDSLGFRYVYNAGGYSDWKNRYSELIVTLSDALPVSLLPMPSMKMSSHIYTRLMPENTKNLKNESRIILTKKAAFSSNEYIIHLLNGQQLQATKAIQPKTGAVFILSNKQY